MVEVSTSILSLDRKNIVNTIYLLEVAHTDYFHIDVMDGKFVEKYTRKLMLEYANTIKHISNLPLDVHLMVQDVKENIDEYLNLEPNLITFHIEACKNDEEVFDLIKYIKENNIKVGLAINPDTDVTKIYKFLPYIHMALIMTVEPGKGGQELIPSTIQKVQELKKYLEENNLDLDIEVDGGINSKNVDELKQSGANIIVSGTYILDSKNYKEAIKKLK